jgi:hypothetical protein
VQYCTRAAATRNAWLIVRCEIESNKSLLRAAPAPAAMERWISTAGGYPQQLSGRGGGCEMVNGARPAAVARLDLSVRGNGKSIGSNY